MLRTRMRIWAPYFVLAAAFGIAACSEDDDPEGPGAGILGTWNATSFLALGMDFIDEGMTVSITLSADGTYSFSVTNDLAELCGDGGGPNCTRTGTHSATDDSITLDEGDEDEITFGYVRQGSTMTWTSEIDGNPLTIIWERD